MSDAAAPGPEAQIATDEAGPSAPAYQAARRRRLHQVLIGALCLLSLAVYANSFRCNFPLDNRPLILEDPRIRAVNLTTLPLIFRAHYWPRVETAGLYRPLTTLTFLFNYGLLGNRTNPFGYHALNLALQCLNIALLYLLAWRLSGDVALAFGTAALWGVHPLLTESVTNIVGRSDQLAGAALLGGLLCHIRGAEATDRRARLRWAVQMAALTLAGVFSKESAVVLPALMLAYDLTFRPRELRRCQVGYLALIPPLAFWWWARSAVLLPPMHPAVDNPLLLGGFWTARLTAMKVVGKYLGLLVFPRALSVDYSYNQIPLVTWHFNRWEDLQAVVALLACAGLVAIAFFCYRRSKPVFFWILFSAITFLPTSNLIVLIGSIMAERFMYLPAIGFAACVATAIVTTGRKLGNPVLAPAVLTLLCLAFACRTFARNFDWKDDETLAISAIQACPNSFKTYKALASSLTVDYEPAKLDRAITAIDRSVVILDSLPDAEKIAAVYSTAGQFYRIRGEQIESRVVSDPAGSTAWYNKARDVLLRGVAIDRLWQKRFYEHRLRSGMPPSRIPPSGLPHVYLQLGVTYLKLKEPRLALETLDTGRRLEPLNIEFYGLMANAYGQLGERDRQAILLIETLLMFPRDTQAPHLLRGIYAHMDMGGCPPGSWDAASEHLYLNPNCSKIREQVCTAEDDLIKMAAEIKLPHLAEGVRLRAPKEVSCAPR